MTLSKQKLLTLEIQDLAFGGSAVSKTTHNGSDFVIFVEGAAPGDTVEVQLTKIKKNYAIGNTVRRLHDSKLRIPARCKHFGICGGCQWQFLIYEEQLKWKEKIVRDALMHIGGIRNPPLLHIRGSINPWFYRNKMEFTFGLDGNGEIIIGLHEAGRFDRVFDLEECYLESRFSVAVVNFVRDWARRKNLTVYDSKKKSGLLKNLVVREAKTTGEFLVNLITSEEPFGEVEDFSHEIMAALPRITSLYHTTVTIKRGMPTTAEEKLLFGKPLLTEILQISGSFRDREETLSLIFDIAAGTFFQPNAKGIEILLSLLLTVTNPRPTDIVWDLYCGTGVIGMFFAKLVKKVYGVELSEAALQTAKHNAEKNNLRNIEFFHGDTTKTMKQIPEKPNLVIVDPPRAGLTPKMIEKLLEISPEKILYVSCNPTTLARDLKRLIENYELKKVQPFDQFPQTYHVETISLLCKQS